MKKVINYLAVLILIITAFACSSQKEATSTTDLKVENEILRRKLEELYPKPNPVVKPVVEPVVDPDVTTDKIDPNNYLKKYPKGEIGVYIPCMESIYDGEDYISGLGISEKYDQNDALGDAQKKSHALLMGKYIGSFEGGLRDYASDLHDKSGKKIDQSIIEGGISAAAKKAIEKYTKNVCLEFTMTQYGNYKAYYVSHVSNSPVIEAVTDTLNEMSIDFDRDRFFKTVQDQLKENKNSMIRN